MLPSQNMKKVDIAYGRRFIGVFLVTMVVEAEFNVPKPSAAQTAHMKTVMLDGQYAIRNSPIDCATIPTTLTIMSPPLSCNLPATGLERINTIE